VISATHRDLPAEIRGGTNPREIFTAYLGRQIAMCCADHRTSTESSANRQPFDRTISNARSTFACVTGFISPISSRNSVPPCACSNFPLRRLRRAGKGSALVSKQFRLNHVSGSAAQFTATNAFPDRDERA